MAYAKSSTVADHAVLPPPTLTTQAAWAPSFSVTTDNRGRALARFSVDAPADVDITPLLYSIARVLRAAFAANIDAGGRPTFVPLSARRLKQKLLKGYPATPLIATRLLRNSLAQRNSQGNVTYITTGRVLVVGSNLRYAAVHQEGGGKGIPARPYLSLEESDWNRINSLITDFALGIPITPGEGA